MKYPIIKIDGKPIKLNKKRFDWYKNRIEKSLTFDNKENDLRLTVKDIELLSWNCAVMVYHKKLIGNINIYEKGKELQDDRGDDSGKYENPELLK